MQNKIIRLILSVALLFAGLNLMAQYEENDAYLVITGMKLNENPLTYVKDPVFGKDAIVKITPKGGVSSEMQVTEFSVRKNGLTYYTADFRVPLDTEYMIEMTFNDGTVIKISDYKLLSSWKTHFYFHSTDQTKSPACILRSQGGLDKDLRLCVFAVYPYSNYSSLGGKETFTNLIEPQENLNNAGIYPNPATNNAVLKFDLDMPMQVNITVKSLSGIVLFDYSGFYQQGENRINILSGAHVPAGLYLVHLTANGLDNIRKLSVR